ncbi:MAG: outer membrane protein transport protein [Gallionella sp.]|nr:outer membrane protein transport protein [Gallionella sp.]
MKINKIVASLFTVGVMATPLAHATNGDEMLAVGSQSTALGGSGVANFIGADSTWANPAMLGKSTGAEVTGGVVVFKPKVTNTGMPAGGGAEATSSANTSYIPDVAYSSRISDNLSYGVAVAGIAGMGVDYTGANPASHMMAKSALSILRVVPTIAYNDKDYGAGFSPIFQSGSLMLSYVGAGGPYNAAEKKESSTGFGYSLGGYYNVSPGVTVAASYQSEIAAEYGTQISGAGNGFGLCQPAGGGCTGAAPFGDDLNQPAEIKAGVAYTMSEITLTADYKQIKWGSAAGYKDFAWEDQTILAIGAKYAADGYWLGLGYNKADDPIGTLPAASGAAGEYRNSAINLFNNMFFPAIVENSYTFGGGYDISNVMAIEAAAVISPKVEKTVDVANFGGTNTTTHSQSSYSVSLRYKF